MNLLSVTNIQLFVSVVVCPVESGVYVRVWVGRWAVRMWVDGLMGKNVNGWRASENVGGG